MGRYTDLLYVRPSLLSGMASVFDIGGTLVQYNEAGAAEDADYDAIRADWRQVGDDLLAAIEVVAAEKSNRSSSAPTRRGQRR